MQEAEGQQINAIQSLADQFEQHLSVLSESDAQLTTSIAEEQVRTLEVPGHDKPYDVPHAADVTLGQSLSEFSELVEAKETALQQLFDDWNNIQTEIIAAAVQILGRDAVEVEEEHLHDELVVAMDSATKEHVRTQGKAMLAFNKVESLETITKNLTASTELTIGEAVKVSRSPHLPTFVLTSCRYSRSKWLLPRTQWTQHSEHETRCNMGSSRK